MYILIRNRHIYKEVNMVTRKKLFVFITFMVFLTSLSLANGFYLSSLGTKATSMGGAFIGLANDYSAIFWNPAGLSLFKSPILGLYGVDIIPKMKYWNYKLCAPCSGICPKCTPELWVDTATKNKNYFSGLVSFYYPLNDKIVAGLGVYAPSSLGAQWNGADFQKMFTAGTSYLGPYNLESQIHMVTISPAIALKLSQVFSLGVTLNFNYASMDTESWGGVLYGPTAPGAVFTKAWDTGQFSQQINGWGFGTTVGVLASPLKWLSVGGTMRLSSTIKFKGTATMQNINAIPFKTVADVPTSSDVAVNFTPPTWAGLGIALKPSENLILTADVQWTNWKKLDVLGYTYNDKWTAAFAEDLAICSGIKANTHSYLPHAFLNRNGQFRWENTVQYRGGIEYKTGKIAWRAGYYHDSSPAPDQTLNVLLPSFDLSSFTVGFGIPLGKFEIDFGLEILKGKQRIIPFGINDPSFPDVVQNPDAEANYDPAYASVMPGTYSISVIAPTVSIVYRFGPKK